MRGLILAAGTASRLRPLTDVTPKCLLRIGGKTILGRTLTGLSSAGIREIVIVTGFEAAQIQSFVAAEFPGLPVTFVHNEVYASTNNIYSLWLAGRHVVREGMILLDSDIIFDRKILSALLASGHEDCLAVNTRAELGEEEIKVSADAKGRILAIGKDVPAAEAVGESIGIEVFSPRSLDRLLAVIERRIVVEEKVGEFYEAAFQELIDSGARIYAVDVGRLPAIEIDTLEDIRTAERDIVPFLTGSGAGEKRTG
jgi:choline kinase